MTKTLLPLLKVIRVKSLISLHIFHCKLNTTIQPDLYFNLLFFNNGHFPETMARHLDAWHNITTRFKAGIE